MCPRPINAKRAIISAEFENLITPKIFDTTVAEKQNKFASFYIEEDDESFSDDDDSLEPEFDLTDSNLGGHLMALNFNEINGSSVKKVKPCETENPNIGPKQSQTSNLEQFNKQMAPGNGPWSFPGVLKMPNCPTIGSKKSVRFADSIGLDLAHVKFFNNDYEDFDLDQLLPSSTKQMDFFATWKTSASTKVHQQQLFTRFPQRKREETNQIVETQNVCIESINCKGMFVSGMIRVKNIAYEKKVRLRYTLDGWRTYAEVPCIFMSSDIVDNRDSFTFSLCLPLDLPIGSCCEMCVSCAVAGQIYWDNNNGENYKLDCCPLSNGHFDHRNLESRM